MTEPAVPSHEVSTPEESDELAPPSTLLSETTLRLITPLTLQAGLRLIGVAWNVSDKEVAGSAGLYCWVHGARDGDPLRSGVLYIGIADGKGGLKARTTDEESWRGGDHAHGIALERTHAAVVAGSVKTDVDVDVDLGWVDDLISDGRLSPTARPFVDEWREERALKEVEEVAIRLAIHLGDTGAPVNSFHAGAWRNDRPADWVAFAIARELTRRHGGG
ncbi:hypothetical protein [Frigoribacterium faeni]|uniref:hypothetical protein n=1 Tax=Frigoribacterium faeni TaxID=145483 RepID=UPI0024137B9B|nr:hypothetical protein [Frigoribacterium faeni]